jgi:hypothetical protein
MVDCQSSTDSQHTPDILYVQREITYHAVLAHEAGLIKANNLSSLDGVCWKPKRLTYQGHEFLAAQRPPGPGLEL